MPNVARFVEQAEGLKDLLTTAPPSEDQIRDLDFMLTLGELFTLVVYGQLILEQAALTGLAADTVDQIFDVMVRDFSASAVALHGCASSTDPQQAWALENVRKPAVDSERFESVWQKVRGKEGIGWWRSPSPGRRAEPMPEISPALYRAGEGEPLVLLHGATATWRCWRPLLADLVPRFDVIAPTVAGHDGGPPFPDDVPATIAGAADLVERQLDELGVASAHFVGNSMGGALSIELAKRGRARSVVAISPGGGWGKQPRDRPVSPASSLARCGWRGPPSRGCP